MNPHRKLTVMHDVYELLSSLKVLNRTLFTIDQDFTGEELSIEKKRAAICKVSKELEIKIVTRFNKKTNELFVTRIL